MTNMMDKIMDADLFFTFRNHLRYLFHRSPQSSNAIHYDVKMLRMKFAAILSDCGNEASKILASDLINVCSNKNIKQCLKFCCRSLKDKDLLPTNKINAMQLVVIIALSNDYNAYLVGRSNVLNIIAKLGDTRDNRLRRSLFGECVTSPQLYKCINYANAVIETLSQIEVFDLTLHDRLQFGVMSLLCKCNKLRLHQLATGSVPLHQGNNTKKASDATSYSSSARDSSERITSKSNRTRIKWLEFRVSRIQDEMEELGVTKVRKSIMAQQLETTPNTEMRLVELVSNLCYLRGESSNLLNDTIEAGDSSMQANVNALIGHIRSLEIQCRNGYMKHDDYADTSALNMTFNSTGKNYTCAEDFYTSIDRLDIPYMTNLRKDDEMSAYSFKSALTNVLDHDEKTLRESVKTDTSPPTPLVIGKHENPDAMGDAYYLVDGSKLSGVESSRVAVHLVESTSTITPNFEMQNTKVDAKNTTGHQAPLSTDSTKNVLGTVVQQIPKCMPDPASSPVESHRKDTPNTSENCEDGIISFAASPKPTASCQFSRKDLDMPVASSYVLPKNGQIDTSGKTTNIISPVKKRDSGGNQSEEESGTLEKKDNTEKITHATRNVTTDHSGSVVTTTIHGSSAPTDVKNCGGPYIYDFPHSKHAPLSRVFNIDVVNEEVDVEDDAATYNDSSLLSNYSSIRQIVASRDTKIYCDGDLQVFFRHNLESDCNGDVVDCYLTLTNMNAETIQHVQFDFLNFEHFPLHLLLLPMDTEGTTILPRGSMAIHFKLYPQAPFIGLPKIAIHTRIGHREVEKSYTLFLPVPISSFLASERFVDLGDVEAIQKQSKFYFLARNTVNFEKATKLVTLGNHLSSFKLGCDPSSLYIMASFCQHPCEAIPTEGPNRFQVLMKLEATEEAESFTMYVYSNSERLAGAVAQLYRYLFHDQGNEKIIAMCDTISDSIKFVSLIDVKPGARRVAVKGVIVELLDDPPQSATHIRDHRYYYRFADTTASVELAVPHGVLQDLVSKNFNRLSIVAAHKTDFIDQVLFPPADLRSSAFCGDSPGFTVKESGGVTMNFVRGEPRNIGSEFAEDSDWSGWSEDENEESLKWLLQPGDVIGVYASTAWSHGHMVLVPIAGKKETLLKLGRLDTNFKLEPDISRQYTSSRD
ncbi:uncharacterized protein BXIN_0902 [Babesia sp. Xinjiang]|uniref:uncharacterized protein n=1 Tax=Babesia sp. Xinjiang TaxID=462227 RepID=UPI000A253187|nr:uncharacterized protein BXIN_0902 [Babesia sp. Xinjiang]ORM42048.1 hypothetical protein BXIN_0902 [Babesia sp. Xinjiang]